MINKVLLIGNLGRDPELRTFETGNSVSKFSVATNENYMDKSGQWQTNTEWHDVVAWRRLSEYAQRNLKKGSLVYVEGRLRHRKYQDNEGKDRYVTEVDARVLRLLEKRDPSQIESASDSIPAAPPQISEPGNTGQEIEDDLPF